MKNSKRKTPKKYIIEEFMDNTPKIEYDKMRKVIPKLIGKSMNTFNAYKNIPLDSKEELPNRIAILLEDFFGLPPRGISNIKISCQHYKEMFNTKPPLSSE
jgi:hypothetical protein